ncbi:MAG: hypothetical protein ABI972_19330 [Acidobacteriota bacterium]
MKEADRIKRNDDRLKELFPTFAARVKKVIKDLEAGGVRPRIQDGYRSPADQMKAFTSGNSKLKFGFHNVTGPAGEKQSLAVDMLDDDSPVRPSTEYLLKLAAAARKNGLVSGVLWGLPASLQRGINNAIAAKNFKAPVKVGWDPTHLEPVGITVAEAKAGKRPG